FLVLWHVRSRYINLDTLGMRRIVAIPVVLSTIRRDRKDHQQFTDIKWSSVNIVLQEESHPIEIYIVFRITPQKGSAKQQIKTICIVWLDKLAHRDAHDLPRPCVNGHIGAIRPRRSERPLRSTHRQQYKFLDNQLCTIYNCHPLSGVKQFYIDLE